MQANPPAVNHEPTDNAGIKELADVKGAAQNVPSVEEISRLLLNSLGANTFAAKPPGMAPLFGDVQIGLFSPAVLRWLIPVAVEVGKKVVEKIIEILTNCSLPLPHAGYPIVIATQYATIQQSTTASLLQPLLVKFLVNTVLTDALAQHGSKLTTVPGVTPETLPNGSTPPHAGTQIGFWSDLSDSVQKAVKEYFERVARDNRENPLGGTGTPFTSGATPDSTLPNASIQYAGTQIGWWSDFSDSVQKAVKKYFEGVARDNRENPMGGMGAPFTSGATPDSTLPNASIQYAGTQIGWWSDFSDSVQKAVKKYFEGVARDNRENPMGGMGVPFTSGTTPNATVNPIAMAIQYASIEQSVTASLLQPLIFKSLVDTLVIGALAQRGPNVSTTSAAPGVTPTPSTQGNQGPPAGLVPLLEASVLLNLLVSAQTTPTVSQLGIFATPLAWAPQYHGVVQFSWLPDIWGAIKGAAEDVGKAVEDAAKAVEDAAKEVGKALEEAGKAVGKAVGDYHERLGRENAENGGRFPLFPID